MIITGPENISVYDKIPFNKGAFKTGFIVKIFAFFPHSEFIFSTWFSQ
jgi:hypothetical protein